MSMRRLAAICLSLSLLTASHCSPCISEFSSPIAVKSRCGSSAPAASWASRRWPSSARPIAAPIILSLADEAYCVGPAKAADSYLRIANVISAAEVGNVQAIHPGYGFLAENAHFNEICRSCNIDFIGPSPEAMAQARRQERGPRSWPARPSVPVVPGSDGHHRDADEALQFAHEVGFPVLIKAVAGGGGRGMRVAANDLALKTALQQAAAEAEAAFGNGAVYLEKYIEQPRHVEVQVLADQHGNAVHLWERDCSVQRRHQKLIEESPSTSITPETREAMCDAARRLIQDGRTTPTPRRSSSSSTATASTTSSRSTPASRSSIR